MHKAAISAEPSPLVRTWSTQSVGSERRLDYWVGAICEAFLEMDCSSREGFAFEGALTSVGVASLTFNQVIASAQDVYRTPSGIARSQQHPFYLITQLHSTWHVRQGGHLAQLRPGDAVLVDSAYAYELHFPHDVACLSVQMPRAWVGQWLTRLDDAAPRVVFRDRGWGQSLSALCLQLGGDPALALAYPQVLLSDQLGATMAAALEPAVAVGTSANKGIVERAESVLLAQLDCAGLAAESVAQELGVSVRTLHRSYAAQHTTFASTLRRHRMARAVSLLAQPRLTLVSIAEVGCRCGYADASHFVREFQRAVGTTPARWRRERLG